MIYDWLFWFAQVGVGTLVTNISFADILFFFILLWMRKLGYVQFEIVCVSRAFQTWLLDFITRGEWSKDQAVLLEQ